ncbi:MAG: hypothetical protein ACTJHC_04300 [Vagococcus sp.]
MFSTFKQYRQKRAEQRKAKIRATNDALQAKGKSRTAGWGKMVNTGLGGITSHQNAFDRQISISDIQKQVANNVPKSDFDTLHKSFNNWWFN